jgi:hypothetical protein
MQFCFWTLASRTVELMASLKEQNLLCMAWSGNQPCASPASKLKRPGGSERNSVGEINALLHGYWPGSVKRNHGARGCLERNEGS